jgi:hypothetical protein
MASGMGAIEEVPLFPPPLSYISYIFLVPKKSGEMRPILNLKKLNMAHLNTPSGWRQSKTSATPWGQKTMEAFHLLIRAGFVIHWEVLLAQLRGGRSLLLGETRKRVQGADSTCPHCGEEEDLEHVLRACPESESPWRRNFLPLSAMSMDQVEVARFFWEIFD